MMGDSDYEYEYEDDSDFCESEDLPCFAFSVDHGEYMETYPNNEKASTSTRKHGPAHPGSSKLDTATAVEKIRSESGQGIGVCSKDLEELVQTEGVEGGIWHCQDSGRVILTIAIDSGRFLLDPEKAEVWAIDPTLPIIFQIAMDHEYTSSSTRPKVLGSFQTPEVVENSNLLYEKQMSHGLSWVLEDRLQKFVDNNWPERFLRTVDLSREKDIALLMDFLGSARAPTEFVYEVKKNNVVDAAPILWKLEVARQEGCKKILSDTGSPAAVKSSEKRAHESQACNIDIAEPKKKKNKGKAARQPLCKTVTGESDGAKKEPITGRPPCKEMAITAESSKMKAVCIEDAMLAAAVERSLCKSTSMIEDGQHKEKDQAYWRRKDEQFFLRDKNYLAGLLHFVEDKMRTAHLRCMVCDDPTLCNSLDLTVCPKAFCQKVRKENKFISPAACRAVMRRAAARQAEAEAARKDAEAKAAAARQAEAKAARKDAEAEAARKNVEKKNKKQKTQRETKQLNPWPLLEAACKLKR
mmetsp:Transcript_8819/g.15651  ORF Transcript_8819/g.15651 Transcript_8819/m.15651 type:complete len:525 (+) Transcript_8819:54-1628(+)